MFFEKEPFVSLGIPAHDTNEKLFIRCIDSIVNKHAEIWKLLFRMIPKETMWRKC